MRLRTFTAATLDDAIAQVRDELGEEAVIVSTYQSRRGPCALWLPCHGFPGR